MLSIEKNRITAHKLILLISPILFLLTACQHLGMGGATPKDDLIVSSLKNQDVPQMVVSAGNVLVLTGTEEGTLGVQNALDGHLVQLGPIDPKGLISTPRLIARGEHVIAMWTETTTGENDERHYSSWLSVSEDHGRIFAAPVVLGEAGRYVSAAEVIQGPDDKPWIVTLESSPEKEANVVLRLYRWNEQGLASSILLEGPREEGWRDIRLVSDDQRAWVAWIAQSKGEINVRWLEVGSKGQVVEVHTPALTAPLVTGMKFLRNDARLMLYWMDVSNQIHGLALNDGESEWIKVDGLPKRGEGMLSGYNIVAAPDGAMHLLYTLRKEQEDLPAVIHRLSADGLVFGDAQRLNTGMPAYMSTATVPEIAFDKTGKQVLVSYIDFRLFRSVIFGNYSHDGGKTWLEKDVPLSSRPGERIAMYSMPASMEGKIFALAWTESPDSSLSKRYTAIRIIDTDDFAQHVSMPVADSARLKGQVEKYWRARTASDYAVTYELYDPFYRRWTPLDAHVNARQRFKVQIHGFEIEEMAEVTPWRYKVKIRYEHELEEMDLPNGKKVGIPRSWVDTEQEWIWIDSNWHVVYVDIMRKPIVVY